MDERSEDDKVYQFVNGWIHQTAGRFLAEQVIQEESLQIGEYVIRVALEPHPRHGDLQITVYQTNTRETPA